MAENVLTRMKNRQLPDEFFYQEVTQKTQIVLLETGRMKGTNGKYMDFIFEERLPKPMFVINKDGSINNFIPAKAWSKCTLIPEMQSQPGNILKRCQITIALDAWGQFVFVLGKPVNYLGLPHYDDKYQFYDSGHGKIRKSLYNDCNAYTGNTCFAYDLYTSAQIEALNELLVYLNEKYHVSVETKEDIFKLNQNALNCVPGTYTQASFSPDRFDLHPQPSLINMLGNLKNKSNDNNAEKVLRKD